jgi:hypothetical protein
MTFRTLFAIVLFAVGIITASAINPEPSAHGSAQSGDLMLTFSAVQHEDGTTDGHATFRDRATNTKVDLDIDCLRVGTGGMEGSGDQQEAVLSGMVTKSTSADFLVGSDVAFTVRDNGEGQNAPPDQFQPLGPAKGACTIGRISAFLTSERGNIVVKADEPAN